MTVTYTNKVANARLGGFSSLLIRWRGSVYKLFYREFLIYIVLYTILSMVYRLVLKGDSKTYFEKLCIQFHHYTDLIPISFVLGFYVSIVVGRWWSQFESLPWPDRLMIIIGSNVHGADDRGRLIRRTLIRYLNLTQVLTYRSVSTAVYKRFPTIRHIVNAGLMTEAEYDQYENIETSNLKYWVPISWFSNLVAKVRQERRIYDDMTYNLIMTELNVFRGWCGQLINYDWISVPLVYTQVVTVAIYMFFMSTLLSRQFLDTEKRFEGHEVDLYVPLFTIGQFFFYMGWLKVAEQLINPFGEDDDDFEVNWCIDRNIELSMLAVDKMYGKHPKLEKDKFWNSFNPTIPYTAASANHRIDPFMGSTFDMSFDKDGMLPVQDSDTEGKGIYTGEKVSRTNLVAPPHKKQDNPTTCLNLALLRHQTGNKKRTTISDTAHLLTSSQNHENNSGSYSDSSDDGRSDEDDDEDFDHKLARKRSFNSDEEISLLLMSDIQNNNVKAPDSPESNCAPSPAETAGDTTEGTSPNNSTLTNTSVQKPESPLFMGRGFGQSPKNRSRGLTLDFEAISKQRSYESGFSTMNSHKEDDNMEERRNAEKRSFLAARRRKGRNAFPPRKRTRRSESGYSLWLRRQQRRLIENPVESPGFTFSESDIGSNPNNDSPFSSMMSFNSSIPSPRPLRFAYKSKNSNPYGDNTSLTSSMASPSGTEGLGTDTPSTPPLSNGMLSRRRDPYLKRDGSSGWGKSVGKVGRSKSYSSSGREESITPYTDDLRKRLQIVSLSTPVPTSPLSERRTFSNHEDNSERLSLKTNSIFKAQPNSKNKAMKKHAEVLRKQLKGVKAGIGHKTQTESEKILVKHNQISNSDEKIPSATKEQSITKHDKQSLHQPIASTPSSTSKEMRRNNSGLWSAFKSWNTKRKEVKTKPKEGTLTFRKTNADSASTVESGHNVVQLREIIPQSIDAQFSNFIPQGKAVRIPRVTLNADNSEISAHQNSCIVVINEDCLDDVNAPSSKSLSVTNNVTVQLENECKQNCRKTEDEVGLLSSSQVANISQDSFNENKTESICSTATVAVHMKESSPNTPEDPGFISRYTALCQKENIAVEEKSFLLDEKDVLGPETNSVALVQHVETKEENESCGDDTATNGNTNEGYRNLASEVSLNNSFSELLFEKNEVQSEPLIDFDRNKDGLNFSKEETISTPEVRQETQEIVSYSGDLESNSTVSFMPSQDVSLRNRTISSSLSEKGTFGLEVIPEISSDNEKSLISFELSEHATNEFA